MTELSAYEVNTVKPRGGAVRADVQRTSAATTVLSLLLIVGLPAAFWMAVLEFANFALAIGLSNATRLTVAGTLLGLLTIIWAFFVVAARQRLMFEPEASMQQDVRSGP